MGQTQFRLIKFLNGHIAIRAVMYNAQGKISGLYLSPPRLVAKSVSDLSEFQTRLAEAHNLDVIELDLPLAAWMKANDVRRLYRGESQRHFEPQVSESETAVFAFLLDGVHAEHERFSFYLNDVELGRLPIDKNEVRRRRKPLEDAVLALFYTMKLSLARGNSLKIFGQRPEGGDMTSIVAEITGFQNHIWATYSQTKNGRDRRHCDLTQIDRIEVLNAAQG
jgi:hypothetical protein